MKRDNGNLIGLTSGMFWGLDTVLIGIVLASIAFTAIGSNGALITTFIHDGMSFATLIVIITVSGRFAHFMNVPKSRSGLIIICAALLGGPIGMGAYILSIRYLGASVSASVSAIYPAIGAILSYIFLKDRLKAINVLGIGIAIGAIGIMGFGAGNTIENFGLGMVFALICVFGWGSEAVIIGAALKDDISAEIALGIRQMVSFITYGLIIMPIIGYSQVELIGIKNVYLYIILIAGIVGTISYLFYYRAIALVGPSRAMGLNISYPAWAFLFQVLIDGHIEVHTLILVIFIMIGSIMSSINSMNEPIAQNEVT
ncbi:DMT family transporter [Erysipelothrix sp. HDW6C]|uniref:DMT family transporter n=1 Tax=Erysipelothrix sp. HDW6C TaxID=2714930 RepID=UPI001409C07B|nr:DMT family transporter [Erysipelothrix sp. HDW6C]QIK70047.1 DMT family transporter [Erysipelothrix sp. HDW6C]